MITLVHAIGPRLAYWVGGELKTSYELTALSPGVPACVSLGAFSANASLPYATIVADKGIPQFLGKCGQAIGFVLGSIGEARPLRAQVRELPNGKIRLDYEARDCTPGVDAKSLDIRQTWDPATDEITNAARPAALISFADFLFFWASLRAFYGRIEAQKASLS